jgi:transcriptional antiterminator RfaH
MRLESIDVEAGLRWYAVLTKPRKESMVEMRLRALNVEVFLPWIRCRRRIGSRYHWVLIPLFPGYLFCRLDLILAGKITRYTPGVKDFVKFGNRIAEVGVEVIQKLKERCPTGIAQIQSQIYRVGDPIRIREGPLSGLEAIFEREMGGSERVAVLLELLGRRTRLVLSSEMIYRL